jgi:hypothetical protein
MTITYPGAFHRNPPAQYDGLFDWEYLRGCFPRGIMPMDFDANVELGNGRHFITFETKNAGVAISNAQHDCLMRLARLGSHTVILQWFKGREAGEWQWVRRDSRERGLLYIAPKRWSPVGHEDQREFITTWSRLADGRPINAQMMTERLQAHEAGADDPIFEAKP